MTEQYHAGNSRHDSQVTVGADDPSCLPLSEIRRMAKETALEMASDHRIPSADVFEDVDLLEA